VGWGGWDTSWFTRTWGGKVLHSLFRGGGDHWKNPAEEKKERIHKESRKGKNEKKYKQGGGKRRNTDPEGNFRQENKRKIQE